MSLIEDLITKETMEYAKRIIRVKNECENIKKFLLGLGYDKWSSNTKIVINHSQKIILLYTKCNSQKNRPSILQSLIDTSSILPGYSLVFGYLKTSKNTGDSGENLTVIYDGYTIEIVSGLHLLKRVFGNAYDLYLENCEKYIKSQLKLDNKTSNNSQQDERTPSEILSSQVGFQSKDGLNHETSEHIINQPILGYNNPNNYHNNNPNNNYHNIN